MESTEQAWGVDLAAAPMTAAEEDAFYAALIEMVYRDLCECPDADLANVFTCVYACDHAHDEKALHALDGSGLGNWPEAA